MNVCTYLVGAIVTVFVAYSEAQTPENDTIHFFLLMVPESKVESLKRRAARQEEGAGAIGAIAEAAGPAANVGQILQGILGGDLRPIFAGSTAFIPDGDFREGITEILQQTVAPGIQRILTEFNKNVQRHFNSTSTTSSSIQQQPINNANNQFQQQQNFNNYNNPYQQGAFQQPNNFNQFQQNQQFGGVGGGAIGGGAGGIGAGGIGAGGVGGGQFNNQYNPNFQQNSLYQQQNYPNNQIQQPTFANNQVGTNQFHSQPNFPPPNYNQYQPPVNTNNLNTPNLQGSHSNSRPPFGSQFQTNISPPVVQPQQQQHQFQPPPQTFPQPINSNHVNQPYVRTSSTEE